MQNTENSFKTLALTLGDLNGIGPEVILKALRSWRPPCEIRIALIGPESAWRFWQSYLNLAFSLPAITDFSEWPAGERIVLFDAEREDVSVEIGRWSQTSGRIAGKALARSAEWARAGKVQAIVTGPVSKLALSQAGYHYPGQTEFLAEHLGARAFAMIMISGKFRVALATTHLPLRQVPAALNQSLLLEKLHVVNDELKNRFRLTRPRIAVTGLNPHAGEGGMLGDEEEKVIQPAIAAARAQGLSVDGPFSADALFGKIGLQPLRGQGLNFDAYLAMYHDQGLIPLKMHGFGSAVNYTAGLPVVRTSPDHGTAYDIAGKGIAEPTSMIEALKLAVGIISQN